MKSVLILIAGVFVISVILSSGSGNVANYGDSSGKSVGMANPAAVYCLELGYEYKIIDTDKGQYGVCIFPDKSECEGWQFLTGKCGQEYSYCARQGYDLITKTDGKNPLSRHYAVCVHEGEEIGSVTDLFSLIEKSTRNIKRGFSIKQCPSPSEEGILEWSTQDLPSYFDWRTYNGYDWMTPVKDQGGCGSCWAFSAVGTVEAVYDIKESDPYLDLDLSEQQLVSCCTNCWAFPTGGCAGGYVDRALGYIRDPGVADEACFPYNASDLPCSDICGDWQSRVKKISNRGAVPMGNETLIKQYLIEKGPLAARMDTRASAWFDSEGILRCPSGPYDPAHAVIISGYNDTGGYWIIKNSWGIGWNGHIAEPEPLDGYFYLGYGNCGIDAFEIYYANKNYTLSCGDAITKDTVLNHDLLNCDGHGLIIGADDIILDCANHLIEGDGGDDFGIILDGDNITVKNCNVQNFRYGINLVSSSDSLLINNTANNNLWWGIVLSYSSYNLLENNTVKYNTNDGIFLFESSYNTFFDNVAKNNTGDGIRVDYNSNHNNVYYNIAKNNGDNGIILESNFGTYVSDNVANNNGYDGIALTNTSDNFLHNNIANNNTENGIALRHSTDNKIRRSGFYENGQYGAYLYNSTYNLFRHNIFKNSDDGMHLSHFSKYNILFNNIFADNGINAYEESISNNNDWNLDDVGNYWDDFEANPGYPDNYTIPGPGDGIDYYPLDDPPYHVCGDVNADLWVNIADVIYLINYFFKDGDPPVCNPITACGDANLDDAVNIADAVYLLNYLFIDGRPPCSYKNSNTDMIPKGS